MLTHTMFNFADADFNQTLAFLGGAVFHVGFFVWVAILALK